MRNLLLLAVILASAWRPENVLAQSITNLSPQADHSSATREMMGNSQELRPSLHAVEANAPVLTIRGLCAKVPPSSPQAINDPLCQTVITRAQFEKLTDAIVSNMNPSTKLQFAKSYPALLGMAREAESRSIQNSERFQERMIFARVQILSQELIKEIDEESAKVTEQDIKDYYESNGSSFEQATLERIFIPHRPGTSNDATSQLADTLRTRALAGDGFIGLQKDAFAKSGAVGEPPNPKLGSLSVSSLPPAHVAVFQLNPGDISPVFTDSSGRYFYKLDAKQIPSLDGVREEIRKVLQRSRREKSIQSIQGNLTTESNEQYFNDMQER